GERKILFVGHSGKGKTHLAAAAIRSLVKHADMVRMMAFVRCRSMGFARTRHPLGEGEPGAVLDAMNARFLVLDDLGQDPEPKRLLSNPIPDIVDARYEKGRTLWVTTFLSRQAISSRYGDGFARRVIEDAVIIQCGD